MNEKYKNFIVQKINSSSPYLMKEYLVADMIHEFGLSERSAKIHIRKFIDEHCWGKDRLAYHYKLSKYRDIFSKDDIYDQIKHTLPRPGRTRWKM